MSDNLSVESPDFDRIRKGDFHSIEDAIRLFWFVINDEIKKRRTGDRLAVERVRTKVLQLSPSGNQNNIDTQGAGVIVYTGASSVNVTGYIPRADGEVLLILVTGAGTITHQNQNASSDAGNRMIFQGAADVGVTTNKALFLIYQNTRWREAKWA